MLLVNRGSRFQGFTPEGERVLDWARRIVGDTRAMRAGDHMRCEHGLAGRLRIAAIPTALAMVAALTTPYRARHPECAVHHLVAHLDRDPRRSWKISRSTPASPISTTSRSAASPPCRSISERYRLLTVGRRAARQPRQRDLGGGRAGAALPADARHAEPPHHRPAAARAPAANSTPTLESNSMILLFSHVRTGRWASVMPAKLAETLGLTETHPRDPDRRAGSRPHHRPGGARARADDAAHRGAGRGSAARRAVAVTDCNADNAAAKSRVTSSTHVDARSIAVASKNINRTNLYQFNS